MNSFEQYRASHARRGEQGSEQLSMGLLRTLNSILEREAHIYIWDPHLNYILNFS